MIELRFAGTLPREGHPDDSCEDRVAYRRSPEGGCRAAVADGAGSTLFCGLWAELLTTRFVEQEGPEAALPEIEPLQRQWFETVRRMPLLWHQQTQLSQGAAAAFLGVAVAPSGGWAAVSVGDCALFQVRGDDCIAAFPAASVQDLALLPALLRTHAALSDTGEITGLRYGCGDLQAGDSLFLMTDALGAWFLQEISRERAPWRWLQDVRDLRNFRQRVTQLNRLSRLKDDDLTLVHLGSVEKE